jgi:hypothetical protein
LESPRTTVLDLDAIVRSEGDWLANRLRAAPA